MRLQALVPPLPQTFLAALDANGIKTDGDLLFSASPSDIFKNLPPGTVSLHDFSNLIAHVAAGAAAPALRGDQYLAMETKRHENIFRDDMASGVPQLDQLVGGFSGPRVVEISGDRGSGKTVWICRTRNRRANSAAPSLQNPDSGVLWMDTTGDFNPERIPALLPEVNGEAAATVLERFQVALAFDIEAAHEVLETMRLSLSVRLFGSAFPPIVRCVVIDSITPLLGPLLSAVSSRGHAIMTSFMRQLRALADAFSLTILVINSSTVSSPRNLDSAFVSTARKPALGPSFTFLTDTTVWLSDYKEDGQRHRDEEGSIHIAEIFRSRTTLSKTWCSFRIKEGVLLKE
ncbi:P-loop containing nucleoside triphosphate hydrolase protein [Amylocystis lapponica]|nr:P-loop containing nucleoside triphosphate hydrolase protein [Amylocystis lapponica]